MPRTTDVTRERAVSSFPSLRHAVWMVMRGPWMFSTNVRQTVVHEVPNELVDHAVVALPSILASSHQLHSSQEGELVTDGGHREPEGVCDVPNAKLLVGEGVH